MNKLALLLLLLVFALFGFDKPAHASSEVPPEQTGLVLEAFNVGSYTYMRLDMHGNEVWVACPPVELKEGDEVGFSGAMMMQDFHSKSLDRTFDKILFASGVRLVSASGKHPSVPEVSPNAANPHTGLTSTTAKSPAPKAPEPIDVKQLEGGTTIAKLFAERESLEGQEVSLRSQVVKFSPNILGKNWIRLQDGTGTAPNNELTVTSSETVEIGDELIVKGWVRSNVDIGAGYTYKVLLEEASFSQ